jgi:alkylated DNA repair dioxygenase AlkB
MRAINLHLADADVMFYPQFFSQRQAFDYFTSCLQLQWQQPQLTLYGKQVDIPRLQAWYGDKQACYQYSGLALTPLPWVKPLLEIKQQLVQKLSLRFNSVLANYYRDGQDCVAWHSDDEKALGENPVIASISLGGERKFQLKHKHSGLTHEIWLKSGDLLLMSGVTQRFWLHQIPRTKKTVSPRINLTFRQIIHG